MDGIPIVLVIHSLDLTANRKKGIHTKVHFENGKNDCLDS